MRRHHSVPWPAFALVLVAGPALAEDRAEKIFRDARQYTVRIRTQVATPFVEDAQGSCEGSGFLVDAGRRWVVTNAHVVSLSPSTVEAAFVNENFQPARKIYVDSFADIAILEVSADDRQRPAAIIDCRRVPEVGEGVGIFGHPMGFVFTGTRGIVSGKSDRDIVDMLQTDATVDHGNSGGPMIALRDGRIVGIATAMMDGSKEDRVNFATPMKDVCRILDLLRAGIAPEPPQLEFALLIDEKGSHTLRVGRTFARDRWPLEAADEIVSVGRERVPVRTPNDLVTALRGRSGVVPIQVIRDGRPMEISARPSFQPSVSARKGVTIDGALIAPFSFEDSPVFREPVRLLVHSVESGTAAHAGGVEAADIVETIDGRHFETLEELIDYLNQRPAGPIRLVLRRVSSITHRFYDYHVRELPGESREIIGPASEVASAPDESR